jgi:hypothetical protein
MCFVLALVESLPSGHRSTMFWGMGSMNDWGLRVVGFVFVRLAPGIWMYLFCGSSNMRALWSP